MKKKFLLLPLLLTNYAFAQSSLKGAINQKSDAIEKKVIEWRHDFHQNPELSNKEFRTAKKVAEHLKSLGIEVQEGVAVTGVIGILKGGKAGPVVALRADMDALPVAERNNLPFKSNVTDTYNGQTTGVMHACGHDSHVAILMGVAEVLASMKNELSGTVKFIFQPAEEGVYGTNEPFGANAMVKAGCLENPKVDAIFGLHINSQTEVGKIRYKPGATMAAVDDLKINVTGTQTHGAAPWSGVDPIVTASQIVLGLQTIVSRNVDITQDPAIVTVGSIHGGIRNNIIPESLEMKGTIRTFGKEQQALVHRRIAEIANKIAESAGAKADVDIHVGYPVTYNDQKLTSEMIGTLEDLAGKDNVLLSPAITGAEDFSFYQEKVPGFFFFLGAMPIGKSSKDAAPHHTPDFYLDDAGFNLGVKALSSLTVDYLEKHSTNAVAPKKAKKGVMNY